MQTFNKNVDFLPDLLLILRIAMLLMTLRFGRLLNFLSLFRIKLGFISFRDLLPAEPEEEVAALLVFVVICRSRALFAIFNASILNNS